VTWHNIAVQENMHGLVITDRMAAHAQGCLLGQLAGDALGSLVEFRRPEEIIRRYPQGVRELQDGGAWDTIAGQPTDDSEMALALARTLVEVGTYDANRVRTAYIEWLYSQPFDCGNTVCGGLMGQPLHDSQANGAMMRVSPLGIFGATAKLEEVAHWAEQDAALTHPHHVCLQANALFAMAIAHAVSTQAGPQHLYLQIAQWARDRSVDSDLLKCIRAASDTGPDDYLSQQGWVLIAFQNALWQLLHAVTLEHGVVDTVMRGGDTDTNAAIAGALLGAVYGRDAIPKQWLDTLLDCRPERGRPNVKHPRPSCYWPVDALRLAEQLLQAGSPTDQ
jgi:ADP-ribosylglycohydrolase